MKYKLCMILAAGLLMACSSDDDITTPKEEKPVVNTEFRPIYVEVSERPMVVDGQEAKERGMETRGTGTTTGTLSSFSMYGVYNGIEKSYSASKNGGGTWSVTPTGWHGSAGNDDMVSFYAHTTGTFQVNGGNPYVNFTVQENASTQLDLLVATTTASYKGQSGDDKVGTVPLTFDHACAAVAFNVQMSNALSAALGSKTLTVSSIIMINVNNTGKYYFGSGTWQDVSGSAYYTMTNSNITVSTDLTPLPANYLFMIPQTRAANGTSGTYLEVKYIVSGKSEQIATIPLALNWQAGYRYTYNIVLGTTLINYM